MNRIYLAITLFLLLFACKKDGSLEGSYETPAHDRVRFLTGNILTLEYDLALLGGIGPHNHIEHCGLPGAVGSNEPNDFTFFNT